MKQLFLLACLALTPLTAMAQPQIAAPVLQTRQAEPQTWKRYTVDGERFSVNLPTAPAMTTQDTLILDLRKTRRERNIGAYADGAVYTIHVYENIQRQSLEDFIAKTYGNGSVVPTGTSVTSGDVQGKQYPSPGSTTGVTTQFFATQGRLYRFSATGYLVEEAVKQFFSSIVFGKNADGINIHDGEGQPFTTPNCDETLSGRDVDRKVRLAMKPEPSYTELARQKQTVGTVVVKAVFACNGSVTDIRVMQQLPNGLTDQAIAALKKLKFVPAVKNGKYVSMWLQVEYNFNLY